MRKTKTAEAGRTQRQRQKLRPWFDSNCEVLATQCYYTHTASCAPNAVFFLHLTCILGNLEPNIGCHS